MARLLTYKCAGIEFDFYDTERVPIIKSAVKYFMTPSRLDEVCEWMKIRNITSVTASDQMEELIAIGLLGEY